MKYTDAVFYVLRAIKNTELDIAINDAANIYSRDYQEYMKLWSFLSSLVW